MYSINDVCYHSIAHPLIIFNDISQTDIQSLNLFYYNKQKKIPPGTYCIDTMHFRNEHLLE